MSHSARIAIAHLPYNQGNFVACLRRAEETLNAETHLMAYANSFAEAPDRLLTHLKRSRFQAFKALRRFDIAVFNYGASLFDPPYQNHFLLDLPYYPRRLKTAMIFQGSDIRTHYSSDVMLSRDYELARGTTLTQQTNDGIIPPLEIQRKQARAAKIDAHIDRLFYFNPDLSSSLPPRARFMRYPFDMQNRTAVTAPGPASVNRPLRVLHLSTNRVLKGTGLVERAIAQAKAQVELDEKILVRVPREVAQAALSWADIVIDQLCLGWYGMQALEALSLGKPVLCNINKDDWKKHMPNVSLSETGFVPVTPQNLTETLVRLAEDSDQRAALSAAAPGFVRQSHNALSIVSEAYGDWIDGYA